MDIAALKTQIVTILTGDAGMAPEAVADAIVLAVQADLTPAEVDPNAVQPTADGSRDETKDSIDPVTGTLTADAVAKRAADKAADDVAAAEVEADEAEVSGDADTLAAAQTKLTAAQSRKAAADAALGADDAGPNIPDESLPVVEADPGAVTTAEDLQG